MTGDLAELRHQVNRFPGTEWISLDFDVITSRQTTKKLVNNRTGSNIMINRMSEHIRKFLRSS